MVLSELYRTAIVRAQDKETDQLGLVFVQQLGHRDEVALGLGHLVAAELHQSVVHPIFDEGFAGGGFGLGDLVLVVREDEVVAPAVNVDGLADVFHAHRGALDVPAGTALAPGGIPGGFVGLGGLPEGEIGGVTLWVSGGDACAGFHFLDGAAGEFPVALEAGDVEIDVAGGFVRVSAVDERPDETNDLRDELGGAGEMIDVGDAELADVVHVVALDLSGEGVDGCALDAGAVDDLVVHVGDVDDHGHVVAAEREVALDGVEDDGSDAVTDVAVHVDGGAADVHADFGRTDGLEVLLGAGERAIDAEGHLKAPGVS